LLRSVRRRRPFAGNAAREEPSPGRAKGAAVSVSEQFRSLMILVVVVSVRNELTNRSLHLDRSTRWKIGQIAGKSHPDLPAEQVS
jgi:hypothetical protein